MPQRNALKLAHTYMLQQQFQRVSCAIERAFGLQTTAYPGIALCLWAKAKLSVSIAHRMVVWITEQTKLAVYRLVSSKSSLWKIP